MLDLPRRAARYFYRRFVLAPLGRGWPLERDAWEQQYDSGEWDFLYSIDEMAHHMLVLGYVRHLHPRPRVLEVGCGSGRFLDLFRDSPRESYHGIDLSASAIERARELGVADATFEVGDFDSWDGGDRRFDIIVFSEVLWYASNPAQTLRRFGRWLEPDGAIVISLYRVGNTPSMWRRMETAMPRFSGTEVRSLDTRKVWDVRVLAPRGAKPRGTGAQVV